MAKKTRVSKKVGKLRREGKPAAQAVAIAIDLGRKGRIGPRGGLKKK